MVGAVGCGWAHDQVFGAGAVGADACHCVAGPGIGGAAG
jgi:hypothetical protein